MAKKFASGELFSLQANYFAPGVFAGEFLLFWWQCPLPSTLLYHFIQIDVSLIAPLGITSLNPKDTIFRQVWGFEMKVENWYLSFLHLATHLTFFPLIGHCVIMSKARRVKILIRRKKCRYFGKLKGHFFQAGCNFSEIWLHINVKHWVPQHFKSKRHYFLTSLRFWNESRKLDLSLSCSWQHISLSFL